MPKLVKRSHLQDVTFNLWNNIQNKLNGYVHQTRENVITGRTVLFDGYVAGAPLVTVDNPGAVHLMNNNTSYFVCTNLSVRANQRVGQITIGVNSNKRIGEVVTGVNIGAIKRSNHEVLDFVITNGIGIVHENTDGRLTCDKAITIDVNVAWNEDVYIMVGANGALWGPRSNIYGGTAMGGGTLPSVGSTLTLNTGNYVGRVVIYGDVVSLRDLGSNPAPISHYEVGELKLLGYDAGESIEIGGRTWLRCDGQPVSSGVYSELYDTIGFQFNASNEYTIRPLNADGTEVSVDFNLPTSPEHVGYLYICAN